MFKYNGDERQGSCSAVELNTTLSARLRSEFPLTTVLQADFLTLEPGYFDRIIMNPPFENGSDIKHIKHALTMLKPGGRLVALCAAGPRQTDQLKPLADQWEVLPAGSFKEQGTNVNVALMVINKPMTQTAEINKKTIGIVQAVLSQLTLF